MDPNAALAQMRIFAALIVDGKGTESEAIELAEAVQALDEWIKRGGFLPAAWQS